MATDLCKNNKPKTNPAIKLIVKFLEFLIKSVKKII